MNNPDLSIIIPAFNEHGRIGKTLVSIQEYVRDNKLSYEVIVVDDGSTDGTADFVERQKVHMPYMRVVRLGKNEGKGAAVKAGMCIAKGRLCLFMDADNSTDVRELNKLLPYIEQGFSVVVGSRRIPGAYIQTKQGTLRKVLGSIFRISIHLLVPLSVQDTQNGFKLFSSQAAQNIFTTARVSGWMFDVEVLFLAREKGYHIKEVPIRWENDPESRMKLAHMFRMMVDTVRLSPTVGPFVRFCMVGVLNTTVDLSVYYVLTRELWTFHDSFSTAKLISYLAATVCSFTINKYWTFKKNGRVKFAELFRFYSTIGLGIFINVGLQYYLAAILGMDDLLAAVFAGGVTAIGSFVLAKWFVFR